VNGKTVLVTGATSGIGKETARGLVEMGARVVIVGRNPRKAEEAAAQLRAAGPGTVEVLLADFASLAEVRDLGKTVAERYPRLDVLVNNAGVFRLRRELTRDGFEETFGVNHLAPFLLTNELLPVLTAGAPARIVTVASGAHMGARLDFDNLQGERGFRSWSAYGRSKLANIMFTYALSRRVEGSGVTANCLHPGAVATNLGSGNRLPNRVVMTLMRPFFLSAAKGAETPTYLASSPEVEGVTGKYFERKRERRSSRVSYDEEAQERLWRVSAELTGLA
jgi:NAD(P)-dependent dehydrogenase (short-subunit alcohol dehydrogenase family)